MKLSEIPWLLGRFGVAGERGSIGLVTTFEDFTHELWPRRPHRDASDWLAVGVTAASQPILLPCPDTACRSLQQNYKRPCLYLNSYWSK